MSGKEHKEPQKFLKDMKDSMKNLVHKHKTRRGRPEVDAPPGPAPMQEPAVAAAGSQPIPPVNQPPPALPDKPVLVQDSATSNMPAQGKEEAPPRSFQFPHDTSGGASAQPHQARRRMEQEDLPIEERYRQICNRYRRHNDNDYDYEDDYSDYPDEEYMYSGPKDFNRLYSDMDYTQPASRAAWTPASHFEAPIVSPAFGNPHAPSTQQPYSAYPLESHGHLPGTYNSSYVDLAPPYVPSSFQHSQLFAPAAPPMMGFGSVGYDIPSHPAGAEGIPPAIPQGLTFWNDGSPALPLASQPSLNMKGPSRTTDPTLSQPYNSTRAEMVFAAPYMPTTIGTSVQRPPLPSSGPPFYV